MHSTGRIHPGRIRATGLILALLVAVAPAHAQNGPSASDGSSSQSDDTAHSEAASQAQLEQLVAPIALYPDGLLAQVLMASTYPLEVVEAARWSKAHPDLKGKDLEDALQNESWDASVKSLTAFPQTLAMMNDKLTWTTQLGDVFLAQQKDVMNSVQILREKAKTAGNLESNEQQTVKVESAATGSQSQTIIIEPATTKIVYVPTYNPTVVYGPWPYPAYAPFYWYPPGYVYASSAISFGVGFAFGAAMWGGCNWHNSSVNINVNNYNTFNRTNIKNTNWNHNNIHRKGVSYGNKGLQDRYGANRSRNAQSRDAFRGRAQDGRRQIADGAADGFKGRNREGRSHRDGAGDRAGSRQAQGRNDRAGRGEGRRADRSRPSSGGWGNGREARRQSNRGMESRSRGGFGRGGGGSGRGGGGFGRGGGGGRGGRR